MYRSTFGFIIFQDLASWDSLLWRVVSVTIGKNVRKAFHKLRHNLAGTDLKEDSFANYISCAHFKWLHKEFYITFQKDCTLLTIFLCKVVCLGESFPVSHSNYTWMKSLSKLAPPGAWRHSGHKVAHGAEQQGSNGAAEIFLNVHQLKVRSPLQNSNKWGAPFNEVQGIFPQCLH